MPTERPVEPAVIQRVEEVRGELRSEQRALDKLSEEHARLQEDLERLQARKQELHREVNALRTGQLPPQFRLPKTLAAPFEVRIPQILRSSALGLLYFAALVSAVILTLGGLKLWPVAAVACGLSAALLLLLSLMPPRWRFRPARAKLSGLSDTNGDISYKDILDIQVVVTPSQRRRGVGTVVVTRPGQSPGTTDRVLIRNVPEPERIADWLRSQRGTT